MKNLMLTIYKAGFLTLFTCISFLLPAQNKTIHGVEIKNIDVKSKPCDDFYQYADGGWMHDHPIPEDQSRWGNFSLLQQNNQKKLLGILETYSKNKQAIGTNEQKLADFFITAMDTLKTDKEGYEPLKPFLKKVDDIKDAAQLQNLIAEFHRYTINIGFGFSSSQDLKDSKRVIGEMGQAGLSLPDKDYYLSEDARSKKIVEEYVKYVTTLFKLLGYTEDQAKSASQTVLSLETALAKASLSRVELRDVNKLYHLYKVSDISKDAPNFNWNNYFIQLKTPAFNELNISTPGFIRAFDSLLVKRPIQDWQTYIKWRLIAESAPYLSSKFEQEHFRFNKQVLTGQSKQQPRWKRSVAAIDAAIGDALGKAYTDKYFTADAKARVLTMIKHIQEALKEDIKQLDWMGDSTKMMALAKLETFDVKIGYPDQWKDYSSLTIDRSSYLMNILRSSEYEYRRTINKIGKPVDRKEWGMTTPTINAYYNPLMNEIVFPAGILQPPFYDPDADDALNYGGMGAVIGHEITHGFDDQGSQFDKDGNLKNWWTEKDKKNFEERSKCIIKQMGTYNIQDSLHMTGELVVGESIADLGGLTLAYMAYRNSLKGKPEPAPMDGFTADQRFFMGWAGVWAMNLRQEMERMMLKTDPHPHAKYRVNAPLSNMPQFQKAFGCSEGSKMVRGKKEVCQIW